MKARAFPLVILVWMLPAAAVSQPSLLWQEQASSSL